MHGRQVILVSTCVTYTWVARVVLTPLTRPLFKFGQACFSSNLSWHVWVSWDTIPIGMLVKSRRFCECVKAFHQGHQGCACHVWFQSTLCHTQPICVCVQTSNVKVLELLISHGAAMHACSQQACVILFQTVCLSCSEYSHELFVCLSVIRCHCSPLGFSCSSLVTTCLGWIISLVKTRSLDTGSLCW